MCEYEPVIRGSNFQRKISVLLPTQEMWYDVFIFVGFWVIIG